ncbi:MAG: hypothetical protein KDK12_12455 [Rhodobacteraceae bacterium]|nr:hypothetical protein [Paracoccaceae bacterium]
MGLSGQGWIEVLRRLALQVALVLAATAGFGASDWGMALLWAGVGIATYVVLPRPKPPEGAMIVARMPSVYMPDLVAALLATTFLAMPFIIAAREAWLGGPWGLMLFMWLPGLVALLIYWIAAKSHCHWLLLDDRTLHLTTIHGRDEIALADIALVRPEVRYPPRWLGPLLVLFGGIRGAGIALLHANRPSHALIVERRGGASIRLPADAFPDGRKLLRRLDRAGVPLSADLRATA